MALGKKMDDVEEELFSDVRVNKQPDPRKEVGLISRKERKHRDEDEETTPRHRSPEEDPDEEPRQITIRVSPRAIERTVFILVILALAGLVVYNPFYQYLPWYDGGNQITGAAVAGDRADDTIRQEQDGSRNAAAAGKADTGKKGDEADTQDGGDTPVPSDNESGSGAGDSNDSDEETTVSSGERTITIDDHKYAIKEWGVKMASVSFTIENHGEPFVPKVRAYVFDKETRQTYEQTPEIKVYAELGKDKRLKATIDVSKFSFQDKESEKTIRLKMYDEGEEAGFANDKHVATVDQVFTAS